MPLTMYGVFCLATVAVSHKHKFIVPVAHFHAESIGASHVTITRITAKLFKFLRLHSQRERTIDDVLQDCLVCSINDAQIQPCLLSEHDLTQNSNENRGRDGNCCAEC